MSDQQSKTEAAAAIRSDVGLEAGCECRNWARAGLDPYKIKNRDGIPLMTNHHENCPHYNDSLITVYKHTQNGGGCGCYFEHLSEALDSVKSEFEWSESKNETILKEKMHREVFENLPEFEGF